MLVKIKNLLFRGPDHGPKTETQQKTFIQVFKEFNQRDAIQSNHAQKTKEKYENFAANLERYLHSINAPDLPISGMKISILEDFNYWLPVNLSRCGKTHAAKHIERIKKCMDYAVKMEYIPFSTVSSFKTKRDETKEVIHLEDHEFLKWINAEWHTEIYKKAQDLYTFQATTGLSYMDLFKYETIEDKKTGLWIESQRGKTKKPYYVPLFHKDFIHALNIHNKHSGKLPYIENHYYNRVIREMAKMLNIEKYLTSHTGRKTFATLKDQAGWGIGPISAMLGNTETICRKHYVKTSRKKIETEILRIA